MGHRGALTLVQNGGREFGKEVCIRKVIREVKAGKRIMHMRFSKDGKRLYISSYCTKAILGNR